MSHGWLTILSLFGLGLFVLAIIAFDQLYEDTKHLDWFWEKNPTRWAKVLRAVIGPAIVILVLVLYFVH